MHIIFFIPILLCWGSFLNVVAYRLLHLTSIIKPRSFCPKCNHTLAWYDLIPVFSWLLLRGKCRYCKESISYLYPLIEIITAVTLGLLITRVHTEFLVSYFIFFSALIITIRTDLETMLISRLVTLFLVPVGVVASFCGLLPISAGVSIGGAFFGYIILYIISWMFFRISKKEGIGQGDFELLAFIGSFIGTLGAWISLLLGSLLGSIVGMAYIAYAKPKEQIKIPFGPFLAFGAMMYVLYQQELLRILLRS